MHAAQPASRTQAKRGRERLRRIGLPLCMATALACPPAAAAGFDLAATSDTECVRGGSCLVEVAIENRGDQQFDGAAGLRGEFDPAVAVESVSADTRGLKCDVTGQGTYECLGGKLSVAPGAAAGIQVVVDIPDDFAAKTIAHATRIEWPAGAGADGNMDNDWHVSTIAVIDPAMLPAADLALAVSDIQGACTAGQPCGFAVTVTNNGPAAFDGTLIVRNATDLLATGLASFSPSDWSCREAEGRVTCTLSDVMLAAGESRRLVLRLATGSFLRGKLTSCAQVRRGTPAGIRDIQRALNAAGYDAGPADGIAGRRTRAAVAAFQKANGLAATGEIDPELANALLGADRPGDAVPENDRACASVQLLAPPGGTQAQ